MHETIDVAWWITAVELPVMGGLFWLVMRVKDEAEATLEVMRSHVETALDDLRESLAQHRVAVASSYVTTNTLRETEQRLTEHLLRLEARLEGRRTSCAAELCPSEGGARWTPVA